MRFQKYIDFDFQDTSRRRAAVRRKQAKEREEMPLFSEQIADDQPTVDEVMFERRSRWERQVRDERQARATAWRRGRAELRSLTESDRKRVLFYWNNHRWLPGTPVYFLDMLHRFGVGRLNLDAPGMLTASKD